MKKIVITVLAGLLLLSIPISAQENEKNEGPGIHRFFNFSLFYPVSLNQSPSDSVNVNLSLIYGRVSSVSGLDFSLAASAVHDNMKGIQIAGLSGVVGEEAQGIQVSGLVSVAGESFAGLQSSGLITVAGEELNGFQTAGLINVAGKTGRWFQASGLANVAGEDFEGGQFSGLFNIAGEHMKGIQAGGLFSIAGETMEGLQASGLFNIVGERFQGLQVSGLFNVAGESLKGLQAGPVNIAAGSRGVQIGLVNIGETCDGLQIGLVNYAKGEHRGFPLGAVNLAENGTINGVIWGSNRTAVSGGMKFYIGRWHSVVSLGIGNLEENLAESLTWGVHYGTTFTAGKMAVQPEVGYRYRDNYGLSQSSAAEPDQHLLEARLLFKLRLSSEISILLGGGIERAYDSGPEERNARSSFLFNAGLELF